MEIKVSKEISKNILTSKDLSDYYAFIESVVGAKSEDVTYLFEESENERIDALMGGINYEVGVYDRNNVKRIIGGYGV